MSQSPTRYPFLFTFRDIVNGNGFVAVVVAHGRALATKEESDGEKGYWFEGVNPGGISAGEHELAGAYIRFRQAYVSVLFDLAREVQSLEEFKDQVQSFFEETNTTVESEWLRAVEDVRDGTLQARGLERKPADSPCYVEVASLDSLENAIESDPAVAA